MSQQVKPKRKNLSPEELLQEAYLFYPENEAFVVGKSKNLYPRATILANIRAKKYGFPLSQEDFKTSKTEWQSSFSTLIFIGGLIVLTTSPVVVIDYNILFNDAPIEVKEVLINLIGLPIFVIGLLYLANAVRMLGFKQRKLRRDYAQLVRHGKLLLGEITAVNDETHQHIAFDFSPPNTQKIKRGYWFYGKKTRLQAGDKIIILYVDDKLSIVL